MALDITQLSGELAVRRLGAEDVPQILTLCSGNPQFYRYHPPMASEDGIRADMQALPPEKTAADKYYVGYFDSGGLAAVLDLILGYPQEGTALIGFFMVDAARQGTGLGSRLVSEAAAGRGQRQPAELRILDEERLRAGGRGPLHRDGAGYTDGPERDIDRKKPLHRSGFFACIYRCRDSTPAQGERGKNVISGNDCRSSSNTKYISSASHASPADSLQRSRSARVWKATSPI